MLKNAFNALCKLNGRSATLKRLAATTEQETAILLMKSNYYASLKGPESITINKREFVIPVDSIATKFSPVIKKGDKIVSDVFGQMVVNEIMDMTDFGGAILGYRIRCE